MADIKTVVVSLPKLTVSGGPGSAEVIERGAVFGGFVPGYWAEVPIDNPQEAVAADLSGVLKRLSEGAALTYIEFNGSDFDHHLADLIEQSDRRTVLAVFGHDKLAFYGFGINTKALVSDKTAQFDDLWPTLAMIGEFYLTEKVSGRVWFEVLKNKSFKQSQIDKLKAALARVEKMLKRENREPWDKHDCA
ncbi:MAG: hypothetical protein LBT47_06630 [Deltaproteobacteria bacterium]|jgi:hypothetical protein|nr:hypothetical protein [Deltaproteobacteria bacterium]